jgi:hypothetical protein
MISACCCAVLVPSDVCVSVDLPGFSTGARNRTVSTRRFGTALTFVLVFSFLHPQISGAQEESALTPEFRLHADFSSKVLPKPRHILVWLPPGYDSEPSRRYPVYTRIWLDIGTKEAPGSMRDVRELRDALVKKGWTLNSDLMYLEADGGTHDEESFGRRAEQILKYFFAPGSAS